MRAFILQLLDPPYQRGDRGVSLQRRGAMRTDLRAHPAAPPTVLPTPRLTQAHCGSTDPGASAAGGTSAVAVSMTVQSGCGLEMAAQRPCRPGGLEPSRAHTRLPDVLVLELCASSDPCYTPRSNKVTGEMCLRMSPPKLLLQDWTESQPSHICN